MVVNRQTCRYVSPVVYSTWRLWAFKQADVEIAFRMATAEEIVKDGWHFATKTDGVSIMKKPR
ncbi:MAG TPA: hypothetical protein DIS79_07575 [Bacteroidetes bacterium]|nr:hypothetical protein [Bacteroidota bacterium]